MNEEKVVWELPETIVKDKRRTRLTEEQWLERIKFLIENPIKKGHLIQKFYYADNAKEIGKVKHSVQDGALIVKGIYLKRSGELVPYDKPFRMTRYYQGPGLDQMEFLYVKCHNLLDNTSGTIVLYQLIGFPDSWRQDG